MEPERDHLENLEGHEGGDKGDDAVAVRVDAVAVARDRRARVGEEAVCQVKSQIASFGCVARRGPAPRVIFVLETHESPAPARKCREYETRVANCPLQVRRASGQ